MQVATARSNYERSDVVLDRGIRRLAHTHIRVGGELGEGKWPGNDRQIYAVTDLIVTILTLHQH